MSKIEEPDRYVSFCGIDCDKRADELICHLKLKLSEQPQNSLWRQYFLEKFEQQKKLNHDNLYYIGAQLNTLYSFFEEIDDELGGERLWKLEVECC